MVVRAPLRAAGCAACRASVLRSFVSNPAPLATLRAPVRFVHPFTRTWQRQSSTNATPGDAIAQNSQKTAADEQPASQSSEAATDGEIPWYLQEEAPRHPTLVHEPAPLPDIPEGSPALIEPLLKFASDDLGLDELNLMDLRSIDPPPALGPNLLMLFGTARSERHLHVSAGSLVRWLRKKGITADADGLLGPNELKIRLRRKARKAKLLGHSGAVPGGDDGISTRWICVNLGTLGYSSEEKELESGDGRFSGFGTPRLGTTVVVQIFTDAKRKELDLESLWSRILKRSENAGIMDDLEYQTMDTPPDEVPIFREEDSDKARSTFSQRRFFSTSARRLVSLAAPDNTSAEEVTKLPFDGADVSRVNESAVDEERAILEGLEKHVFSLPYAEAVQELQNQLSDEPPTVSDFMSKWRAAVKSMPSSQSWHYRLTLKTLGRRLKVPGYTLGRLRELHREMQLSGIQASRKQYLKILQAIYWEPQNGGVSLKEQSEFALDLLETLYERGEAVIANDIVVTILETLIRSDARDEESMRLRSVLEKLPAQTKLPYMGEALLLRLLDAYATEGNWEKFWETWRIPPRFRVARSAEAYFYVYTLMAQSRHQSRCIDTVRWCFQEMLNEDPPVQPEGNVLYALKDCIRIADPHAEQLAKTVVVKDDESRNLANREFVKLFRLLEGSSL